MLSRIWALWGVVNLAPEACSRGAVTLFRAGPVVLQTSLVTLLFCWCVTEVLRYGFYAAKVGTTGCPSPYVTHAPCLHALLEDHQHGSCQHCSNAFTDSLNTRLHSPMWHTCNSQPAT